MQTPKLKVVIFPFGTGNDNPYQSLIRQGLEANNVQVIVVPGRKFFPLFQLRKHKPDIVHLFWPYDMYLGKNLFTKLIKQTILLFSLRILRSQPLVYSADNLHSHSSTSMDANKEINWLKKIIGPAQGIIFATEAGYSIFKTKFKLNDKLKFIIPHVSLDSAYKNVILRQDCRDLLGVKNQTHLFTFVGRIQPYKGLEEIIEGFTALEENNIQLVIAGKSISSTYSKFLTSLIKNKPIILKDQFIPNDEMQFFLNGSDTLIVNYTDTPLNPGSLVLAKNFGVPVIAPDHPVINEVMKEHVLYSFQAGSIASLTEAMKKSIDNKHIFNVSPNNQNKPAEIGQKLVDCYHKCIALYNLSNGQPINE